MNFINKKRDKKEKEESTMTTFNKVKVSLNGTIYGLDDENGTFAPIIEITNSTVFQYTKDHETK